MFVGSKKKYIRALQDAVQRLRDTEDKLVRRQVALEHQYGQSIVAAIKHGTQSPMPAIHALEQKYEYEAELKHVYELIAQVKSMRDAFQSASSRSELLALMESVVKAFKKAHTDQRYVERVSNLLADITELQDAANMMLNENKWMPSADAVPLKRSPHELLIELEDLERKDRAMRRQMQQNIGEQEAWENCYLTQQP